MIWFLFREGWLVVMFLQFCNPGKTGGVVGEGGPESGMDEPIGEKAEQDSGRQASCRRIFLLDEELMILEGREGETRRLVGILAKHLTKEVRV